MIKSKNDYLEYIKLDKEALGIKYKRPKFMKDEIWRFERLLRKTEYFNNCHKIGIGKVYSLYLKTRLNIVSRKLGFTIPINTFGAGLSIAHRGTIVVNQNAKIGKNCRIHVCVNIGANKGGGVPIIGDDVYIGPGAKIFGEIKIANGINIGANAIVNKSFEEPNITIVGVPAKKVK